MHIGAYYSHLNGLEFLIVHKPKLWEEIKNVIEGIDAAAYRTKESREKTKIGRTLYSPIALNAGFKERFKSLDWQESRTSYWVTEDSRLIQKTMHLSPVEQKKEIEQAGFRAIYSYNQTDFVKERIAVEVQFGKYFAVAFDLFVKHMAFFVRDVIDVGIEIMPMKQLQEEMSSGVPYYEGELYNLIREGRGVPAVPLVLIGIVP